MELTPQGRRLKPWKESATIGFILSAVFLLIEGTEACTRVFEYIHNHPEQELDAFVLAGLFLSVGATIFAARRVGDLQAEANFRRRTEVALRDTERSLRAALADTEAATLSKNHFLANMSHEIRTPLNGVVSIAELLQTGLNDPHEREMAGIIVSSGRDLERLLGDILDLQRLEAGKLSLNPAEFKLSDALHRCASLFRTKCESKSLAFKLDVDPACDVVVHGDETRLVQILNNLVSNAVKFTQSGSVSLTGRVVSEGRFVVSVADTGPGFSLEDKARLFQRFEQADGSITRQFGGSGLGLAIARDLARMLGGDIDCDATPGVGAEFRLTFGMATVAKSTDDCVPDPPFATLKAAPAQVRLAILAADDHPINRKVIELIVAQVDADIAFAENGQEAIDAFKRGRFDLVLMDMQMPVLDGLSAVRAIRQLEIATGQPRTPIMVVTANAQPESYEEALTAGADGFLLKPFSPAALLGLIDQVCAAGPDDGPRLEQLAS